MHSGPASINYPVCHSQNFARIYSLYQDAEALEPVHNAVEADIVIRGARIWVLISAIIFASVGLNMNSTAVIFVTLIPSVYYGYVLVRKEHFIDMATRLVRTVTLFKGDFLFRYVIDGDARAITLVYGGHPLTGDDKTELNQMAETDRPKLKIARLN